MNKPITWSQLVILVVVIFILLVLWANFGYKITGPGKPPVIYNTDPTKAVQGTLVTK